MISSFKIFENEYYKKRVNNIMNTINSAKVGDVLSEDIIYQYVQIIHGNDDFMDGDLGDRIEEYSSYILKEVNISDLNIDEYYRFDDLVDEYSNKYTESGWYPPIVISPDNILIDGNHRANALNKLGIKKIKAFVGID